MTWGVSCLVLLVSLVWPMSLYAGTTIYKYDGLDRLYQVWYNGTDYIEYGYDEVGNLLTVTPQGNVATITASSGSNGSVFPSGITRLFKGGDSTYSIIPNAGYEIGEIFVDEISKGPTSSYSFTNVNSNHTIRATFFIPGAAYLITFIAGTGGTLLGTTPQEIPYHGETSAVTAIPGTGHHFVNWTGDVGFVTTTNNPLTITKISTDQHITANFDTNQYTITFAPGLNGSVSGDTSQLVSHNNATTSVTAIPDPGFNFRDWTVAGGVLLSTANPLILTNITNSQNITANFGPCPVRIPRATPLYFTSLQSAYNAAVDGDSIQALADVLSGDIVINKDVSVTFDGGYAPGYNVKVGTTSLKGSFSTTSSGGAVIVKDFFIHD